MQFVEQSIRFFTTPKGLNNVFMFNPFGVVIHFPYYYLPELHSGLFLFNPFGIVEGLVKLQLGIILIRGSFFKINN